MPILSMLQMQSSSFSKELVGHVKVNAAAVRHFVLGCMHDLLIIESVSEDRETN